MLTMNSNLNTFQSSQSLMKFLSITLIISLAMISTMKIVNGQDLSDQLNQRKKCTQYGHSCLGGHGKRNSLIPQSPSSSLSSASSSMETNNNALIQQLPKPYWLTTKPFSIPLYIYRHNNDDNQQPQQQQQQQNDQIASRLSSLLAGDGHDDYVASSLSSPLDTQQQQAIDSILERLRSRGVYAMRN